MKINPPIAISVLLMAALFGIAIANDYSEQENHAKAWEEFHVDSGRPWATCVEKIKHVRVVHFLPGILRDEAELKRERQGLFEDAAQKPPEKQQKFSDISSSSVTLGVIDAEFVRQAQSLLDKFWDSEISVISTTNIAEIYPQRQDELSLVLVQNVDGSWRALAVPYFKKRTLRKEPDTNKKNSERAGLKRGTPEQLGYRFEFGGVYLTNPKPHSYDYSLAIFLRSLQDLVAGRCDRIMSKEGIHGSGYKSIKFEFLSIEEQKKMRKGEPVPVTIHSVRMNNVD